MRHIEDRPWLRTTYYQIDLFLGLLFYRPTLAGGKRGKRGKRVGIRKAWRVSRRMAWL